MIDIGKNNENRVTYENQPDVERVLFPNITEGASPEEIANAVNAWLEEHPEATTTIEDGSILPIKINSTNSASDGYVLAYNATEGKFEWLDIQAYLETKADVNGNYPNMTVGNAEQLVSSQYVEDSVPYLFRTTGGSADVGNREYVDAIVGGSLVWNQIWDYTKIPLDSKLYSATTYSANGVTFTKNNDGSISIQTDENGATSETYLKIAASDTSSIGRLEFVHFIGGAYGGSDNTYCINYASSRNAADGSVFPALYSGYNMWIKVFSGAVITTPIKIYPRIINLTQMFGSTIADYVYSLETATAGAGVAWLKQHFPAQFDSGYQEYNPGEIKSVSGLVSHDTVGFNQWDEVVELGGISNITGENTENNNFYRSKNYVPLVQGADYYFKFNGTDTIGLRFYDAERNYIDSFALTTEGKSLLARGVRLSQNAKYLRFVNTSTNVYNHDICINLSWSGTHNGEYQPYEKHSYPLDDSLTLRGIPKLDSNNELYYDGDRYLPDGTVQRRYGVVDLGTLDWSSLSTPSSGIFRTDTSVWEDRPKDGNDTPANAIIGRYVVKAYNPLGASDNGYFAIGSSSGNNRLVIIDTSYTDAAAFKAAMSGVMLLYELATPTTETADPYQEVQICNDWGTEEYVLSDTAFPVPVGHNTRYPANLRDKLQHLPDLADADGYYAIKQVGTQMSLELFRIPKAPTSPDGTYTLKATVSGGTPTYTWVADE